MDKLLNWLWDTSTGHGFDFVVILLCIGLVAALYRALVTHIEALVSASPSALLVVDQQNHSLLLSNRPAMELLGIRLIGEQYRFPNHIDSQLIASLLEQQDYTPFKGVNLDWPTTPFQHIPVELTGRRTLYKGRKVWLIYATLHQSTDEEYQRELSSLSIAKSAFDSLSELIFIKDNDGALISTNRAFDRFWAGRREEGAATFEGVMKGRASQRRWTVTPDGRSCLLETYQSILMSPKGEPLGLLSISHDVTDWHNVQKNLRDEMEKRKDTEVALAQRDTILQNILEASPDSIGIFDENMVYQACNQPFVEALGIATWMILLGNEFKMLSPVRFTHDCRSLIAKCFMKVNRCAISIGYTTFLEKTLGTML